MTSKTTERRSEPSGNSRALHGALAWLLAAGSAGLGFLAVTVCGIPFVPPASRLAVVLGIAGGLAALASVVFAFLRGRVAMLFLAIVGVLLTLNGFAISLGRLGKHLIDYLEGH